MQNPSIGGLVRPMGVDIETPFMAQFEYPGGWHHNVEITPRINGRDRTLTQSGQNPRPLARGAVVLVNHCRRGCPDSFSTASAGQLKKRLGSLCGTMPYRWPSLCRRARMEVSRMPVASASSRVESLFSMCTPVLVCTQYGVTTHGQAGLNA